MDTRARHWREALVLVAGALPIVTIWLHAYSHSPPVHPEPTRTHALLVVALATAGTLGAAWLGRGRLRVPCMLLAVVALAGPVLLVATGLIWTRTHGSGDCVSKPVAAALGAAAGCAAASLVLALAPLRTRQALALVPLTAALALGHAAYLLPAQTAYALAETVGRPYPAPADFICGGALES